MSVPLNGKVSADLDWNYLQSDIQHFIDKNLMILWKLDLGLFKNLKSPLSNQTQFLSLILSLEHLRDSFWKKFQASTLGVCLYSGSANFALQMNWDEQLEQNYALWCEENRKGESQNSEAYFKSLFARDAAAEYLTLMANRMPDAMQLFLDLEMDLSVPTILEMQLLNRERFDRFHLMIRNAKLPTLSSYQESVIGLCLPSFCLIHPDYYQRLEKVAQDLSIKNSFSPNPRVFSYS
ncbi:MAG: hypothetical protein HWD61_00365 [Parachlamydiaceae bacterium]|nr:MAG: hypothetical protein HWD61_00365 [Parachlamydiaceae bacterium]